MENAVDRRLGKKNAEIAKATAVGDPLSKEEKAKRRRRGLIDLAFFAQTYFPHYLTASPSLMHCELLAAYQVATERSESENAGSKLAYAAPRGNAKSTLSTLVFPLWCIVGGRRNFIGILSDTTEQAVDFVEFIKAELVANHLLREDFPEACGEGRVWQTGGVITANNVKVKAWGKRKRIRGARHGAHRPDLIICDDLEDDENVDSPEQREKDRKWFFQALMKAGAKGTVYLVVGTILHYDSLLERLLKQPGWRGKKFRAVIEWSASPLWEQWERIFIGSSHLERTNPDAEQEADEFFTLHRDAMLAETQTLWPEVEDYYYLMKMRASEGPACFDSEKQNEPVNPKDCLFQEEWFQYWDEVSITGDKISGVGGDEILCAVDPSMGKQSRRSDPSAIVIGALRPDGALDILKADIQKRHPDAILEAILNYHETYRFTKLVVETVQFQEFFKDQLEKAARAQGMYFPIEGVKPTKDKILRIQKLQPLIKNGRIRFRRDQKILLEQLKYFPKADHDDGPDALEMVVGMVYKSQREANIRSLN